jgi:class 3 adenylate cyclase
VSRTDNAADRRDPGAARAERRPAVRRQLAVMACELVGLAVLSTRLDPEDLREVMAACHKRCAEIIERHHGYVTLYSRDGVLAYFGYPQAQEQDAERAVQVGLALVGAVPELATAAGVPL